MELAACSDRLESVLSLGGHRVAHGVQLEILKNDDPSLAVYVRIVDSRVIEAVKDWQGRNRKVQEGHDSGVLAGNSVHLGDHLNGGLGGEEGLEADDVLVVDDGAHVVDEEGSGLEGSCFGAARGAWSAGLAASIELIDILTGEGERRGSEDSEEDLFEHFLGVWGLLDGQLNRAGLFC